MTTTVQNNQLTNEPAAKISGPKRARKMTSKRQLQDCSNPVKVSGITNFNKGYKFSLNSFMVNIPGQKLNGAKNESLLFNYFLIYGRNLFTIPNIAQMGSLMTHMNDVGLKQGIICSFRSY